MALEQEFLQTPALTLISINPTTGKEFGSIVPQNRGDIDRAFELSQKTNSRWASLPIKQRQAYLKRVYEFIIEEKQDIAELIAGEQGKPVPEALAAEVIATLAILKDLIRHAHKEIRPQKSAPQQVLFANKKNQYRFEPYGTIVIISPWNFPFSTPLPEIAAALVAGNTVLFKPAPQSIFVGQKIDSLFQRAGLPKGVLQTLYLQDTDAPYLTENENTDKIIFTGSTEVGQKIMCSAAPHLTPFVLELGGKDPAVIAADANLERAAKGCVWGSTFGSGQVCAAVERIYVEKPVADKFINLCLEEIRKIKVGDPLKAETEMGPLSVPEQLEIVKSHVEDAVQKGATLLHGGNQLSGEGFFFEPTLITNVHHGMKVMSEETFGPILTIMPVNSMDDAIAAANASPYGLSAYGWTSNKKTADRLLKELKAGTVMINDATSSWGEPTAPWGGYKKSGIGRTRSRFGLQEMVQIKFASYEKGTNKSNLWWHPYDKNAANFFRNAIDLLYSASIAVKIKSLHKMIKNKRFLTSVNWGAILLNLKKIF